MGWGIVRGKENPKIANIHRILSSMASSLLAGGKKVLLQSPLPTIDQLGPECRIPVTSVGLHGEGADIESVTA